MLIPDSPLVSRKLRALMELVPVEPPAAGPAAGPLRELPELGHVPLGVVAPGETLQILPNQLVEALPHGGGLLARPPDEPLVHGQGDVHAHILRGHGYRVYFAAPEAGAIRIAEPEEDLGGPGLGQRLVRTGRLGRVRGTDRRIPRSQDPHDPVEVIRTVASSRKAMPCSRVTVGNLSGSAKSERDRIPDLLPAAFPLSVPPRVRRRPPRRSPRRPGGPGSARPVGP